MFSWIFQFLGYLEGWQTILKFKEIIKLLFKNILKNPYNFK